MIIQRVLFVAFYVVSFSPSSSQSLEGEWEGWYSLNNYAKDTALIKLQFHFNKDSTYDVYSFTKFKNDKTVCKMSYKMLHNRTIYLEENELVRTNNNSIDYLFQKMTLKFDPTSKSMQGKWSSKMGKVKYTGSVSFSKKI